MVIDTGSKRIIIDTGYGQVSPTVGKLPQSLAAAGIDSRSIDIVLVSHMHGTSTASRHQMVRSPSRTPRSKCRRWIGPSG
jgi:hypothetical protein